MRPLTVGSFRNLLSSHPPPCVSIYMPIEHGPRSLDENRLRYRHLLDTATKELAGRHGSRELATLFEPLRELLKLEFWAQQKAALALFSCPRFSTYFNLPDRLEELVIVAASFHVRPLLALLQSNQHFFLLELSHKSARLFRGSRVGLAPVDLHGASEAPETTKERTKSTTRHAGGRGASGPSIVHGAHGDRSSEDHEETLRYLRSIDRSLLHELAEERSPLVLAAPRELAALYRQVSRYPGLVEEVVQGNFDHAAPHELFERAWPVVQAELARRTQEKLEAYERQIKQGRATAELSSIARYAVQGRVRELFLAQGENLWGRFDRESGALELAPRGERPLGDDVLDDIAEAVLMRGGEVLSIDKHDMPAQAPVAALLRW